MAEQAQDTVAEVIRKQENDYINGTITLGKYVEHSMYETIETILAYLNSKHTSGLYDSQNREKPFFNICTAIRNIWYRATDLDRKNLRIKATKATYQEWLKAFWATAELKEWMRRERFGVFLNDWGRTLADYGTAVVKFVEQKGKLVPTVVPWNRLIVDAVEFGPNPKIEVLYLTASQLRQNELYDQDMVEKLIETRSARETAGKQKQDNKADYIKLYEIHGELPLSYLTGKEKDEKEYRQQMHVVSFVAAKEKGKFNDFSLYKGKEKNPHMITYLIKEDGRTLGIGAVESAFESQWMTNHTAREIKNHLDIASKLVFQTSDGTFVGRNVLTSVEQGDIMVHKPNEPLTQINNGSHDITSLQNFSQQWQMLAKEITSTPEAIRGDTMPSGTAWRQVEALQTESHSLFEIMRESKGLHVEDMLREYVIPYLKKEIKKKHSIVAELDKESADMIDEQYINAMVKEQLDAIEARGEFVDPVQVQAEMESARQKLRKLGGLREQKMTEDLYQDYEWEVEFDITDESTDKDAILTTLNTVFTAIASNPLILQDPNAKMLFNRILEEVGAVSPVEFQPVQQQVMSQETLTPTNAGTQQVAA